MNRFFLSLGAVLGAISVILGALAAHKLRQVLAPAQLELFETAVRYQFYHVFAILITGIILARFDNRLVVWAGNFFGLGILFFSGSLYAIAFLLHRGTAVPVALGLSTPVGGLFFIVGWLMLAIGISRK